MPDRRPTRDGATAPVFPSIPHGPDRSRDRLAGALVALALALALPSVAVAQDADRMTLFSDRGTTLRATLQYGINAVSEANLFWNLSDFTAPGSGFDPDTSWVEVYVEPGLSFETALDGGGTVYGRISAVASYTVGTDAFDLSDSGRATLEESHVGFRTAPGQGPALDLSLGARELRLGTGMLISDGASDGFERGALKFGPRSAWEMAAIAELGWDEITATLFHIDPRELPDSDNRNLLAGFDLRHDDPRGGYLGLTYVNVVQSDAPYPQVLPGPGGGPTIIPGAREGTNTLNLYARTNPFAGSLEGLLLATDLAYQWNERIDLTAWAGRLQVAYRFEDARWTPTISYGYQTFSGDDPTTAALERFDPLYYDGSPSAWATGSKSAMVFINSNVQSHNLALSLQPTARDTVTFRYAHVRANELGSPIQFGQATRPGTGPGLATGVAHPHLSDDFYIEYRRIVNRNTFLTAGISVAVPGEGIRGVFPGDDPNWVGGFVNVVFNF